MLGIGDDAAIVDVPDGAQIVVTTDTQVEAVHFPTNAPAAKIGYRSCAAALSDIAAMGATARWVSLAITLPRSDAQWLELFAAGAASAIEQAGASLIGGDTTAGPFSITWSIIGTVPVGAALKRSGAGIGDGLYVSGCLGAASAAVALLDDADSSDEKSGTALLECYWSPRPRLELGRRLRGIASSCIDISDGLLADAQHVCRSGNCGAIIELESLPVLPALCARVGREQALLCAAAGGDDYELCFSVPPTREADLYRAVEGCGVEITRIGQITDDPGIVVVDASGRAIETERAGYRHFD